MDGDREAALALDRAARQRWPDGRLRAHVRDLHRNPVSGTELDGIDAVVFDPPRAGARDQAAALAESAVPMVVAVSCDAKTFARDAALLQAGGYGLDTVTPIDQFRFSAHVEIIGLFRRD